MRPYLCISRDEADREAADRLARSLTRYGFHYEVLDNGLPRSKREAQLAACSCALVLTSPAAEGGPSDADIRFLLSQDRPAICLSLSDNALDHELCVPADADGGLSAHAAELIPYPADGAADPQQTALLIHRLYIRRLCRYADCFSVTRCVDDVYGRAVRQAVSAWSGSGEGAFALAALYESGEGVPCLESEVVRWIEAAAGRQHTDALLRLAAYRLDAIGGVRDADEALSIYRRVSASGDARGLYGEGICALYGFGMLRDPAEAVRLFSRAAEDGDADVRAAGRYRLGLLRQSGDGMARQFWGAAWDLYRAADDLTGYRPPVSLFNAPSLDDGKPVFTLFSRRPVSCAGEGKPIFRVMSLRSMTEQKLLGLLAVKGVYPKRHKSVMARCRYRRTVYPEAAWLAQPPVPAADAAVVSLDSRFARFTYHASMAAYALGCLLEDRCRRGEAGTDAATASAASTNAVAAADSRLDYPPMPAAGRRPAGIDALRWYRLAASCGHSGAMHRLGDCYRSGFGVPRDPVLAVRLYERAAALGDRESRFALGVCYECGEGVPQDGAAAVAWYEKSAKAGYVPAMNNLGGCCERGFGVEKDLSTAVDWYTRAAKLGQPEAAYRLARCAETGRGLRKDIGRAADLYRQAADAGNPYAAYRLGLFYDLGLSVEPHFTVSARLYEQAARAGVAEAAYAMGLCARSGRGCRRDSRRAFRWFRAGAGQSVQAAFEAGCCLYEGQGTIRDYAEAVDCFRQAADLWAGLSAQPEAAVFDDTVPLDGMTAAQAGADALYMLGFCALYGIGAADEDRQAGIRYLKLAAEQGHAAADTLLGDLYAWGWLEADGTAGAASTAFAASSDARRAPGAGTGPVCAPAELCPHPWKTASSDARAAAVEQYRRAADRPDMPDRLCRQGQADALISLALERSVYADERYADGRAEEAAAADAACWQYLSRAYALGAYGRDMAGLLMASAVYGKRYPAAEADPDEERVSVVLGLLRQISPASPAYASASLILAELELDQAQGGAAERLDMPPYQRAAALYIRAAGRPRVPLPDADADAAVTSPEDGAANEGISEGLAVGQTAVDGTLASDGPLLSACRFRQRADCERAVAEQVKGEALYRLAILTATHLWTLKTPTPSGTHEAQGYVICFEYLARAVMEGHGQAADDLARMLAARPAEPEKRPSRRQVVFGGSKINGSAGRQDPAAMMREFYTANVRVPLPFACGRRTAHDASADVSPDVSPDTSAAMRAAAMNFLGDCLYFGQFLTADRAAAVTCFRAAADTRLSPEEADCPAVTWAKYSLGCCLIHGIGCPANPREGVACLTAAAKTHAVAAYTLADCFEKGIGVDPGDYRSREAVRYYRRAMELGFRPAEDRLKAMKKQLS